MTMVTKEQRDALLAVRRQAQYLRRIEASVCDHALHSRRHMKERRRYNELEKAAREAIETMQPRMYAFCVLYYIHGVSLAETGRLLDRSERQCKRYRLRIERDPEGQETHER